MIIFFENFSQKKLSLTLVRSEIETDFEKFLAQNELGTSQNRFGTRVRGEKPYDRGYFGSRLQVTLQ